MANVPIDWSQVNESLPVTELLSDGKWTTDVLVAITGYIRKLGEADNPSAIRIYTSLDLNEYVEVATNQVRKIAPNPYNPTNATYLDPVTIWVNRFTKIDHAQRRNDETVLLQENFLAGDVVDQYFPGVVTEGLPLQRGANIAQVLESLVARCSFGGCGDSTPTPCVH